MRARRLRFITLASATALLASTALSGTAQGTTTKLPYAGPLHDMSWGFMFKGSATAEAATGAVRTSSTGRLTPDTWGAWDDVAQKLIAANTSFVRANQPLNMLRKGTGSPDNETIEYLQPNPDPTCPAESTEYLPQCDPYLETGNLGSGGDGTLLHALTMLHDSSVEVGAAISVTVGKGGAYEDEPRDTCELIKQAQYIRAQTDEAGRPLYDFLFLDHSGQYYSGTWDGQQVDASLQHLVDLLRTPQDDTTADCGGGGGWNYVMTNDTPFNFPATGSPVGPGGQAPSDHQWAHARELQLLKGDGNGPDPDPQCQIDHPDQPRWFCVAVAAAEGPESGALTDSDRRFIAWVHANDDFDGSQSHPVLKLEVSSETNKFAQLPLWTQCTLLADWSDLQDAVGYQFKFVYPLYAPGHGTDQIAYDSTYIAPENPGLSCSSQLGHDKTYHGTTNTYSQQQALMAAN